MPLFDLRKLNASLPVASSEFTRLLVMGAADDFIVVVNAMFLCVLGKRVK